MYSRLLNNLLDRKSRLISSHGLLVSLLVVVSLTKSKIAVVAADILPSITDSCKRRLSHKSVKS